jgi:dATP pyrophosphohydrolase
MSSDSAQTTRLSTGVVDVVVMASARGPVRGRTPWRILTLRRAAGVRCTGAWELVHGRIEPGERPAAAARREVREETGLTVDRLYSIAVNPFYIHQSDTVHMAIVFAAVVNAEVPIVLGNEHDACRWRAPRAAIGALAWPREHEAVRYAVHLLRQGDAGAVDDVLRVPE